MNLELNKIKINVLAFEEIRVGPWWNYRNHSSPFMRIFMVFEGQQTVKFNGNVYIQKPGSIYIVPPFTKVDYYCDDNCLQFYMILSFGLPNFSSIFNREDIKFEFKIEPEVQAALRTILKHTGDFGLDYYDPNSLIYQPNLNDNIETKLSPIADWKSTAIAHLLLTPFLNELEFYPHHDAFNNVTNYIEKYLEQQINLKDLAHQANLSPTYFSDKFANHFKQRPMQYIQSRRIKRAQILLMTKDYSIEKIAHKCGFKTSAHFCRIFKNSTQMTPKQYRAKISPGLPNS